MSYAKVILSLGVMGLVPDLAWSSSRYARIVDPTEHRAASQKLWDHFRAHSSGADAFADVYAGPYAVGRSDETAGIFLISVGEKTVCATFAGELRKKPRRTNCTQAARTRENVPLPPVVGRPLSVEGKAMLAGLPVVLRSTIENASQTSVTLEYHLAFAPDLSSLSAFSTSKVKGRSGVLVGGTTRNQYPIARIDEVSSTKFRVWLQARGEEKLQDASFVSFPVVSPARWEADTFNTSATTPILYLSSYYFDVEFLAHEYRLTAYSLLPLFKPLFDEAELDQVVVSFPLNIQP